MSWDTRIYFPRSFDDISLRIKMANIRTTWNYGSKTNLSTSHAVAKYFRNFQTFAQRRSLYYPVYVHEKHSIGITSSLQTSGFVIKMFHPQNSVVNSRVKSSLNVIAKTRLFLFWLFEYSLLFFWILTILSPRIISTVKQYVCNYHAMA